MAMIYGYANRPWIRRCLVPLRQARRRVKQLRLQAKSHIRGLFLATDGENSPIQRRRRCHPPRQFWHEMSRPEEVHRVSHDEKYNRIFAAPLLADASLPVRMLQGRQSRAPQDLVVRGCRFENVSGPGRTPRVDERSHDNETLARAPGKMQESIRCIGQGRERRA